jgi:hypothetical protein
MSSNMLGAVRLGQAIIRRIARRFDAGEMSASAADENHSGGKN